MHLGHKRILAFTDLDVIVKGYAKRGEGLALTKPCVCVTFRYTRSIIGFHGVFSGA